MMQTFYSRPATVDYCGSLDEGITFSMHCLVLCNELAGMLRKMWEGIRVNETMIATELTLQEGPRGNYLAQPHTAGHCRTEVWDAKYLGANLPVTSSGKPDNDLITRIGLDLEHILATHRPAPICPDILQKIRLVQQEFKLSYKPN